MGFDTLIDLKAHPKEINIINSINYFTIPRIINTARAYALVGIFASLDTNII